MIDLQNTLGFAVATKIAGVNICSHACTLGKEKPELLALQDVFSLSSSPLSSSPFPLTTQVLVLSINGLFFLYFCQVFTYTFNLNQYNMYRMNINFL